MTFHGFEGLAWKFGITDKTTGHEVGPSDMVTTLSATEKVSPETAAELEYAISREICRTGMSLSALLERWCIIPDGLSPEEEQHRHLMACAIRFLSKRFELRVVPEYFGMNDLD